MPSRYFYCDRPLKMGGKVYDPFKSYPIPKAHVPELIVLSEGGLVHLTETQMVPAAHVSSLPTPKATAPDKPADAPKPVKAKRKRKVELP